MYLFSTGILIVLFLKSLLCSSSVSIFPFHSLANLMNEIDGIKVWLLLQKLHVLRKRRGNFIRYGASLNEEAWFAYVAYVREICPRCDVDFAVSFGVSEVDGYLVRKEADFVGHIGLEVLESRGGVNGEIADFNCGVAVKVDEGNLEGWHFRFHCGERKYEYERMRANRWNRESELVSDWGLLYVLGGMFFLTNQRYFPKNG